MAFHHNPAAEEFDRLVAEHDHVAVDFFATWCQPCKAYSPKFSRLDREVRRRAPDARVAFAAVDIDLNQDVARRYGVRSVPTTIVLAKRKGWLGREKVVEALRFSGDRAWPELLRDVLAALGRG